MSLISSSRLPGRMGGFTSPTTPRQLVNEIALAHGGPGPAAIALRLALLHGERQLVAAGIARHQLEFGAEDGIGGERIVHGARAGTGGADRDLAAARLLDRRHGHAVPDGA